MSKEELIGLIVDDVNGIEYWTEYLRDDVELLTDRQDFPVSDVEVEEIIEYADKILSMISKIFDAINAEEEKS